MTLKNNRAPLLCCFQLCAWFHCHMWLQTGVRVRKRLSWVLTSVTLTFDLWPWPFAWTSLLTMVITPDNFMMIRWWEHGEKGVTDRRTDRRTENTICRAAWSQLKIKVMAWYLMAPCHYLTNVDQDRCGFIGPQSVNNPKNKFLLLLTHWSMNKMAAISQTLSNAFSWKKNILHLIQISQKFVHCGPVDIKSTLVQVMAWCQKRWQAIPEPIMTQIHVTGSQWINKLRPRQMAAILQTTCWKCIFVNENLQISIKISLKFVPNGPIIPALFQIMAWRWPDIKPLFEHDG